MQTLRELDAQLTELLMMCEDGEIDEKCFCDTVEAGLVDDIAGKADGYGTVMSHIDAECEVLKAEIDRLTKRKKVLENHKESMKGVLQRVIKKLLESTGEKNLKGQFYTFGIKKNPPALKIDNPDDIPFDYMIPQPPKVDNERIKEELKSGAKLEFAHLEQGESLTIK